MTKPSQNQRILQRLKRGHLYNYEFRAMGILNYTARISELRAKGHVIEKYRTKDWGQGVFRYRLAVADADIVGVTIAKLLQMKFRGGEPDA